MTTIAYKDGVIAYDSRCTAGDKIIDDSYNKRTSSRGVHYFFVGATSDHPKLIALYEGELDPEEVQNDLNAAALVVDKDGLYYVGCNTDEGVFRCPQSLDSPRAIGSGADHAITAMDLGLSARDAVKMAAKRDTGTGGRVRTYKLKQRKGAYATNRG